MAFQLKGLEKQPGALAEVPLFLLALLVARGVPALFYVRAVGRRRAAAGGLLQATSLTFVIVAVDIGQQTGKLSRPPRPPWSRPGCCRPPCSRRRRDDCSPAARPLAEVSLRYASEGISRSAFRCAISSLVASGTSARSRKSTAPSLPTNG